MHPEVYYEGWLKPPFFEGWYFKLVDRGYIEKDWGKAFPHSWLWLQTNHFTQPGTSLSASVPDGMDRRITESLQSTAHVVLKEHGQVIFEDTGARAGMEIVGVIHLLMGKS